MNSVERVMERIKNGEGIDCMSCGEQIAAALIMNRADWLPEGYKHPLDAISRLGLTWLQMCIEYHQNHQ